MITNWVNCKIHSWSLTKVTWILHSNVWEIGFYTLKFHSISKTQPSVSDLHMWLLSDKLKCWCVNFFFFFPKLALQNRFKESKSLVDWDGTISPKLKTQNHYSYKLRPVLAHCFTFPKSLNQTLSSISNDSKSGPRWRRWVSLLFLSNWFLSSTQIMVKTKELHSWFEASRNQNQKKALFNPLFFFPRDSTQ